MNKNVPCELWSFRSDVTEDYVLLRHDAASRDSRISTFRRNALPSSLRVIKPMMAFEDEGSMCLRYFEVLLLRDAVL